MKAWRMGRQRGPDNNWDGGRGKVLGGTREMERGWRRMCETGVAGEPYRPRPPGAHGAGLSETEGGKPNGGIDLRVRAASVSLPNAGPKGSALELIPNRFRARSRRAPPAGQRRFGQDAVRALSSPPNSGRRKRLAGAGFIRGEPRPATAWAAAPDPLDIPSAA